MRILHSRLLIQSFKIIFLSLFTVGLLIGCNPQSNSSVPTNSATPTSPSIGLQPGPEIVGRYRFDGSSMEPNLHDGEYVLIDELAYVSNVPQRGDVILFKASGDRSIIKRVIGLPGETIEIRDKKVLINGVALNEPYLNAPTNSSLRPETIEPNRYFIMGDNRNNSSDSRSFGTIPASNILGRVAYVYAPVSSQRIVPQYVYTTTVK
jgi:signal peptidase I